MGKKGRGRDGIPKRDRRTGYGYWWVPPGTGKGTPGDPHVHFTIHTTADGELLPDTHVTVEVERKKRRIAMAAIDKSLLGQIDICKDILREIGNLVDEMSKTQSLYSDILQKLDQEYFAELSKSLRSSQREIEELVHLLTRHIKSDHFDYVNKQCRALSRALYETEGE